MNTQTAGSTSTTTTSTSNPEVTQTPAKAAYAAACEEAKRKIEFRRLELLAALIEAEEINAEDDYKGSLLMILEKYPAGLPLATIQRVFGDAGKLRTAKNDLIKHGWVREDKPKDQGNTKVLVLVK